MKLIVGLGNPGKEYDSTRHNIGFMFIDKYVIENKLTYKEKFNGLYTETIINKEKVILLKPQSYMNLSGSVVRKYIDYYKINIDDVFIIYDDMDFEIGTFKIKPTGSSGGHNGIRNIIECLNTENIKRLRIGISKNNKDKKDYVLGKINKKELEVLNKIINMSNNIINDFINLTFEEVMNKYN